MAETGCLHNNKYVNLNVKEDSKIKDVIVKESLISGDIEEDTSGNLSQAGNNSHLITTTMTLNTPFQSFVDLTTTGAFHNAEGNDGEDGKQDENYDISGRGEHVHSSQNAREAVEAFALDNNERLSTASSTLGGNLNTTVRTFAEKLFNYKFTNIFSIDYNTYKSSTAGGVDYPTEEDVRETLNLGDGTSVNDIRIHFIKWPRDHILKELVIIPNQDLKTDKTGDYGTDSSENVPDPEKYKKELLINLFVTNKGQQKINSTTPERTQAIKNGNNGNYLGLINDTGVFANYGNIDSLRTHTLARPEGGYAYLIREFPIISSPDPNKSIIWRKYTPISIIRDIGTPIEIKYDDTGENGEWFHQHGTASSSDNILHGNTRIDEKIFTEPSGSLGITRRNENWGHTDYNAPDVINWNYNGELFSFSSFYRHLSPIMADFSDDTLGLSDADITDTIHKLKVYMQDGRRTKYTKKNTVDNYTTNREVWNGGMFINSSNEDLYLALTIGHSCPPSLVASTPIVGNFNEHGADAVQYDAPGEGTTNLYPSGDFKDTSNNPITESTQLKFKAIFTFKKVNSI